MARPAWTVGVVGLLAVLVLTTTRADGAEPTGVLWPGAGRMLAGSLVLGGTVVGDGSLEVVDGVITRETARFDDAPAELSLRMFTFVPDGDGGGYSAVLRYRVPIVQLHQWRGSVVRMSQTVVLRPPSGQAQAVQIQADGTTAVGTYGDNRTFSRTGDSDGRIDGNVVVIHVPASVGVTSDWTVQAIVEVTADAPFHRNRPATGYLAGTSIASVGWLAGDTQATADTPIADALTTLAPIPGAEHPQPPDPVRVTGVRVEGTGVDQTVVVTTAGSPLDLPANAGGHISVELTPPFFSSIDHPFRLSWLSTADSDAVVIVNDIQLGSVHVTVAGNETRFAIGKAVPNAPFAIPAGSRLDTLNGSVVVTLGPDGDIVSSADGLSTVPPAQDQIIVALDGPNVTVVHPSTNTSAAGFVGADGHFVALNATEYFSGTVDAEGNAIVHLTRKAPEPAAGLRRPATAPLNVPSGDYTTTQLNDSGPTPVYQVAMAFLKGVAPPTALALLTTDIPALDLGWMSGRPSSTGIFTASGQPSGAQGGQPDWPLEPLSGAVDSTSGFLVSVTAGTLEAGLPTDLVTPFAASAVLAAAAPALPSATTTVVVPRTTQPAGATVTTLNSTGTVAANGGPIAAASKSDGSSGAAIVVAIVVLLAVTGIVVTAMSRRRRASVAPPIAAVPLPITRSRAGPRTTSVSHPVQSWSIGVRAAPGERTTSARAIEPEDQAP